MSSQDCSPERVENSGQNDKSLTRESSGRGCKAHDWGKYSVPTLKVKRKGTKDQVKDRYKDSDVSNVPYEDASDQEECDSHDDEAGNT
ncbi:hypothetical protein FSP39_020228 [Pinctada imbricata]|uniref:Uncharacterized protein n=1 Tax=Pinctada imbricata TaxID=66713 RepID=A0AA89C996_PINIB|nr:hypothetical protein FSP39_020228 [Pinctada imbricata]